MNIEKHCETCGCYKKSLRQKLQKCRDFLDEQGLGGEVFASGEGENLVAGISMGQSIFFVLLLHHSRLGVTPKEPVLVESGGAFPEFRERVMEIFPKLESFLGTTIKVRYGHSSYVWPEREHGVAVRFRPA